MSRNKTKGSGKATAKAFREKEITTNKINLKDKNSTITKLKKSI